MSPFSSILLVGATGTFGSLVAGELAKQRESFTRIAVYHNIARKTDDLKQGRLDSFKAAGLEIVIGDGYTATEPFLGFDCVMIFSGNYGLHEQPQIIDSAIAAGARHFYPSEYGADLLVGENWSQRYYKYKVLTREHLEKRAKEYPDLGWTYFVVGRLTEWAVISHFGVQNREASAQIYGTASGRQSLIGVHDAITYLVATLEDTDSGSLKGLRRTYRISGTSPTYKEIFDTLNHITGREYEVTYLNVEDAKLEEAEAKARQDVDQELAASHKLIQGRQGTLLPQPWDNDRFPQIRPKSVEECLRAAFNTLLFRKAYGLL